MTDVARASTTSAMSTADLAAIMFFLVEDEEDCLVVMALLFGKMICNLYLSGRSGKSIYLR